MSERGLIDRRRAASRRPVMPYAWQLRICGCPPVRDQGSTASVIARDNTCILRQPRKVSTSHFISEQLDHLSLRISKQTVVVLDNAKPHTAKPFKSVVLWERRGLTLFYLPPYSPQLNLAEILAQAQV